METVQEESSAHEESSSSDQEQDPEVFFPPSQAQVVPNMFMPYIKGPKMDWTVNDGLYHRFLKWHLKCENILECELVMLPERRQCKKVIAWTGDFGMDLYEELTLDTILEKFESSTSYNQMKWELCFIFSQASGKETSQWMSGIMLSRPRLLWLSTLLRLPRYFTGTFFVSSLKMKSLSPSQ